MSLLRRILLVWTLGAMAWAIPGQLEAQSDLELATYYYNSGAFEQARLYLDNLYKKDPSTYDMYLNTLLELEDFEAAEKLVKGRLKKRRDKSMAQVDLGSLYLRIGRTEDAQVAFLAALDALPTGRGSAKRLADAFIKLDQLDLALATYEKARDAGTDNYGYHYELANSKDCAAITKEWWTAFCPCLGTGPTTSARSRTASTATCACPRPAPSGHGPAQGAQGFAGPARSHGLPRAAGVGVQSTTGLHECRRPRAGAR